MRFTKNTIFKYLFKLHIFGSLFCSVYLLIVGLSSLNFQHQFLPGKATDTISYSRTIQFDPTLKVDSLARYLHSQLGIKGHVPPWEFKENKNGMVRFKIFRPVRTFEVRLNRNSDLIEIDEIHYGIGRILGALHEGSIKNKLGIPMLDIWAYYAQISAILAFITIVTSIFFWFKKSIKSMSQWVTIILSGVFSFIFMVYIWLIG